MHANPLKDSLFTSLATIAATAPDAPGRQRKTARAGWRGRFAWSMPHRTVPMRTGGRVAYMPERMSCSSVVGSFSAIEEVSVVSMVSFSFGVCDVALKEFSTDAP